jgi:hypothetical protein
MLDIPVIIALGLALSITLYAKAMIKLPFEGYCIQS